MIQIKKLPGTNSRLLLYTRYSSVVSGNPYRKCDKKGFVRITLYLIRQLGMVSHDRPSGGDINARQFEYYSSILMLVLQYDYAPTDLNLPFSVLVAVPLDLQPCNCAESSTPVILDPP